MERHEEGVRWPRLIGAILACQAAGGVGAIATSDGVKSWYPRLRKPDFTPPSGVFGPVWTTLYLLMGIAEYVMATRAERDRVDSALVAQAHSLFAAQLVLNAGWSFLFFKLRRPFTALIELLLLWVAIILTILAFARISRLAALLLVPYLLWTTFAAALNGSIWWLNRDRSDAKA
jgi:tryptophan-rich sensory protein